MFGHFCGKFVYIIGLKAPGDYSDQFWSIKILVLLCEEPKLPNSMISGVLSPGEPLFVDFILPKWSNEYKKSEGRMFGKYDFHKYASFENGKHQHVGTELEKTGDKK